MQKYDAALQHQGEQVVVKPHSGASPHAGADANPMGARP